jgi:DMSO/TMAO reductase YedYZ molybdopterin-dependent catalytic subunit
VTAEPQVRASTAGGALLGLAAGAVAVGVATAFAALGGAANLFTPAAAPVVAAGGAVVDRVPLWLKNLAVNLFGTADKAVLLAGVLVVLALACAVAGTMSMRPGRLGQVGRALFVLLGVVGAVVVLSRPESRGGDVIPMLTGTGLGIGVLTRGAREAAMARAAGPSRRTLLTAAAGVGLGAVGGIQWGGGKGVPAGAATLPPTSAGPLPSFTGVDPGIAGQTPYLISPANFYRIDTALSVPQVDAGTWRLTVSGLVDREVTLDYATLAAKPLVHKVVTLTCVSNEVGGDLCGNAIWTGWPVRDLLAQAGVKTGADMVLSTSVDGWTAGTPLEALTDDRDALLAIAMNGKPLPAEHGYPVRLVVPGLYGYVSATKWVTELKVTRFDADQGYWTPRGWAARGPVKTASRIDVPADRTEVQRGANGLVAVAGVAWAQHRGITAVEVQVDGGSWQQAELSSEPSIDAWRQWVYRWAATPGRHTLAVRATDGAGDVQTAAEARPDPDGATGHHTVDVEVVA